MKNNAFNETFSERSEHNFAFVNKSKIVFAAFADNSVTFVSIVFV